MKNFKGFIFTVDAIFSLIVAASAISILVFAYYSPTISGQAPASEAFSVAQNFLGTTLGQASHGIAWATYLVNGSSSLQYTWPQYGYNGSSSSGTPAFGPQLPFLKFSFQTLNVIYPVPVVADGMVFFVTQGSNSRLYGINATTGNVILNTTLGASYTSGPLIFNHFIYTANSAGITALSESNSIQWTNSIVTSTGNVILGGENGKVEANLTLFGQQNGTIIGNTVVGNVVGPAAYLNGIFVTFVGNVPAGTNSILSGYFLDGSTLQPAWSSALLGNKAEPISIVGNIVVGVANGNTVYAFTQGGKLLWQAAIDKPPRGAIAGLGGNLYVESQDKVYAFNTTGKQLFSKTTMTNNYNVTPAATPTILYTVLNGNVFAGFSTQNGNMLWNVSLPTTTVSTSLIGDVAVAYGNAYFASGNTLYVFGMCSGDPNTNLLQALAGFYVSGQGGCANILLNKTYGSGKIGVYINNTYGPSVKVANFNGISTPKASYIEVPTKAKITNTTISFWMYPTRIGNGVPGSVKPELLVGLTNQTGIVGNNPNSIKVDWQGNGAFVINVANAVSDIKSGPTENTWLNQWVHIAVTVNNQGLGIIYANGAQIYSSNAYATAWNIINPVILISGPTPYAVGSLYVPYGGQMADVQVYNTTLNLQQVSKLYQGGIAGTPLPNVGLVGWWPLEGDTNDYSGQNPGFPSAMNFTARSFVPPSLAASYEVSRAAVPLLLNLNNTYKIYNVSVVVWR